MPTTDSDYIKKKSHVNICSQSHCDISDQIRVQKLLLDDLKGFIANFDISKVGNEITWTERMPSTNPDRIESRSHGNNYNKSYRDGDRVNLEKQGSDNLESPE